MDTFLNAFCFVMLSLTMFQMGRAYQLLVEMREDNERHIETMRKLGA